MDRPGHNKVSLFVGTEVEHTPAVGLKTLFVVGVQPVELIDAAYTAHKCTHIYFGANASFGPDGTDQYGEPWDKMISHCLKKDYLCTLDFDSSDT